MSLTETTKILAVIKATYPQYYKGTDKADIQASVKIWQTVFMDHSYEAVSNAVMAFIANDAKGFPPAPGMIMDKLINLNRRNDITEGDAWRMVRKALSNSRYNADTEFAKLPELVKMAVGDADTLKSWAEIPTDELDTVTASNFMRAFKARASSERQYLALPSNVKNFIKELSEGIQTKQLGGGTH